MASSSLFMPGPLAGLNPTAEQTLHEDFETAAGVIDFVGLLVTGGDERLIEAGGAVRLPLGRLPTRSATA